MTENEHIIVAKTEDVDKTINQKENYVLQFLDYGCRVTHHPCECLDAKKIL